MSRAERPVRYSSARARKAGAVTSPKREKRNPKNRRKEQKLEFERKLRDYRRFLKDDADYDWHFIIRMLRYKLERTRDHLRNHNIVVNSERYARQIQKVVDLLLRIEAEPYFEELHKPFWKKYGKPRMIYGKADERGSVPVTVRYAKETARNRKQIGRELKRLSALEHRMRARDLHKAFQLMEKYIWYWWD